MMIDGFPTQGAPASINASISLYHSATDYLRGYGRSGNRLNKTVAINSSTFSQNSPHCSPSSSSSLASSSLTAPILATSSLESSSFTPSPTTTASSISSKSNINSSSCAPMKIKFTEQEDQHLIELVKEHGPKDWIKISKLIETRNPRQCRERWKNYLNPDLRKDAWSQEEDELLAEKVAEFGGKWNKIGRFFQNRSDNNIRNRWMLIARRKFKTQALDQEAQSEPQQKETPSVLLAQPIPMPKISMPMISVMLNTNINQQQQQLQLQQQIQQQQSQQQQSQQRQQQLQQQQMQQQQLQQQQMQQQLQQSQLQLSMPKDSKQKCEFSFTKEESSNMNDATVSEMSQTVCPSFDYFNFSPSYSEFFDTFVQNEIWNDFVF